ncbi:MAG: hypothetical protein U0572_07280 [Phycisphaerales bacterium]
MLSWLTLNDRVWLWLEYLPIVLALIAGLALASGLLGVRGWAPRCRRCGHDLRAALDAKACPECGADLARRNAVRQGSRRLRWLPLTCGVALAVLAGMTAPNAPWRPLVARRELMTFIPSSEILVAAANAKRSGVVGQELQRRMTLAEPEFVGAVVDAACADIGSGAPLGASNFTAIHDLGKADRLDQASRLRISDAVVSALTSQTVAPAAILGVIPKLGQDPWIDELLQRVLAIDSVVDALVTVEAVPTSILMHTTGTLNVRVGKSFSPNLAGMLDVRADRVTYRRIGADEWLEMDNSDDLRRERIGLVDMIPFSARDLSPGEYEVRCELSADRVGPSASSSARRDPLRLTRIVPVKVISADEVVAMPRRDDAAREIAENLLSDLRIEVMATEGMPSVSFRRAFNNSAARAKLKKPGSKLYITGTVAIEQDGHAWQAGEVTLSASRMTYGGAERPEDSGASPMLDPNKPMLLRITPAADVARRSIHETFEFLDEIVELRLDRSGRAPTAIVWPSAKPDQAR